jgi:hypothetical protein
MTYKLAGLLDSAVGGIDLPFVNVMGFGIDLNTTVSDLMRIGAMGAGILGSFGSMIDGLSSSFNGQRMLSTMGIKSGSGLEITPRGNDNGVGAADGGGSKSTSGSGYVGNGSGSDVKNSTIQESKDSKKQQMIEAKEEEPSNQVDILNMTVVKIYELLDDVANGKQTLRVRVDSYGLTGANSTNALGGVSGLGGSYGSSSDLGGGSTGGYNSSVSSGGSTTSGNGGVGVAGGSGSGSIDLGGWTML